MDEEYKIDDFGEAHLVYEKNCVRAAVTAFGTIQAIEKKFILFKDNDGYLYLVAKKDFTFTKYENKLLIQK